MMGGELGEMSEARAEVGEERGRVTGDVINPSGPHWALHTNRRATTHLTRRNGRKWHEEEEVNRKSSLLFCSISNHFSSIHTFGG